ncbi:MAG: signal transduction histidine kinase, nitrogen specific, NtrB [Bryobacterales bacterium]|nr:signal transduction histidine kinase, nitrogen specific, NtrB [Bryobacterales bacterium]
MWSRLSARFKTAEPSPDRIPAAGGDLTGSSAVTIKTTVARIVRPQDFVWLVLFSALAYASADRAQGIPFLLVLAALQVLEPKVEYFSTPKGNIVSILLKLSISYVLIGLTGGLTSSYYLILLLPLVSAATTLGQVGSALFTLVCCGAYASFLLPIFIDPTVYEIDPDTWQELFLRLIIFAATGYLINTLAAANREQTKKFRSVAEQLAVANRSLSEAEAAMRRSERLAALGQLSAGLAHELRNPLGTIKASAEMLTRSMPPDNEVAREVAGFISSEVDRTNLLVTRFLEFARPLRLRLATVELTQVLDSAVANLERNSPHYDVAVYKNYAPEIGQLAMDADLMERVFYNLLLNAAQATPAGGAITVKTRLADGNAEISVIDRGSGIDPKDRESIFNPFFTTKPEGVGLGLAIVSKIVDEHGGKIAVESEPGKGSIFRLYLPIRK